MEGLDGLCLHMQCLSDKNDYEELTLLQRVECTQLVELQQIMKWGRFMMLLSTRQLSIVSRRG